MAYVQGPGPLRGVRAGLGDESNAMSLSPAPDGRAKEEAAAWFARLNTRSIPATALEEFRIWRQTPGNREAYAAIEAIWSKTGKLRNDPEMGDAVTAALARTRKSRPGVTLVGTLKSRPVTSFGFTAITALALLVSLQWVEARSVYSTGVGEQRLVRLDDGSRVRLDTQTQIKVRFGQDARRVVLEKGQAFFDVAKDAGRPFVVAAGTTDVQAVGTRFDVRRDDGKVRVILVDGVVEVRTATPAPSAGPPQRWTLKPGEQLTAGRQVIAPRSVDVAAATSWTDGRITFRAVPLTTAIAEVNRYSDEKIELDAPLVGAIPVSGIFNSGDTEAFVAAVSDLHGLRAVRQADGTIRLTASPASAG